MPVNIGELLMREGLLTQEQRDEAISEARKAGVTFSAAAISLGYVADDEITGALSREYQVPSINLDTFEVDPAVLRVLPGETCRKYLFLPVSKSVSKSGEVLSLAMVDPTNVFAMDDVYFMTGCKIDPIVASETAIANAIEKYYGKARPWAPPPPPPPPALEVDRAALKIVSAATCRKYNVIPVATSGSSLRLAMSDPSNAAAIDDIKSLTGFKIYPVSAPETSINDAIERHYGPEPSLDEAEAGSSASSRLDPRLFSVFLNYRRQDVPYAIGRIADRLRVPYGTNQVFHDVRSIGLGADFRQTLDDQVSRCRVMLCLIGDRWLSVTNASGARRLDDPNDFVRIEIELALARNIPVVPLLLAGASFPLASELPESLKKLSSFHGIPIRPDPDFDRDMNGLILDLNKLRQEIK